MADSGSRVDVEVVGISPDETFDGAGGTTLIGEADASGTRGYSSVDSGQFSHIVDNTNEALVIVASLPGVSVRALCFVEFGGATSTPCPEVFSPRC